MKRDNALRHDSRAQAGLRLAMGWRKCCALSAFFRSEPPALRSLGHSGS